MNIPFVVVNRIVRYDVVIRTIEEDSNGRIIHHGVSGYEVSARRIHVNATFICVFHGVVGHYVVLSFVAEHDSNLGV